MAKRNEHFDKMGRVLLESVWPIVFSIEPLAYITFTFHLSSLSTTNNNHFIEIGNILKLYVDGYVKILHFIKLIEFIKMKCPVTENKS